MNIFYVILILIKKNEITGELKSAEYNDFEDMVFRME